MPKDEIRLLRLSEKVAVSVVIPHFYASRENNLKGLLKDLQTQTFREMEVLVIRGVSPQGKAINEGVRAARGDVLVIIDDDSRLGHPEVIENLVRVIRDHPSVGMVGASVVTSDEANWFQKMAAKQFPRFQMPVVKEVIDSDLPGHPCAAFQKDVFVKVGMEREDILRGLDPDLRERIRKAGYRIVLAPETWIYHPLPDSLLKFIRVFLRNGYGSAYLESCHPEINFDTDEVVDSKHFVAKRSFFYRIFRFFLRLAGAFVTLRWLRLLGYSTYLVGYFFGYLRFQFFGSPRLQKVR